MPRTVWLSTENVLTHEPESDKNSPRARKFDDNERD